MPNPAAGGLETPNVSPADALIPGLLKLKPDVLELPKPEETVGKVICMWQMFTVQLMEQQKSL